MLDVVDDVELREDDIVVLAVKTQDVNAAAARWRGPETVVTVQNGLEAERVAARYFPRVVGAVTLTAATHVVPGEITVHNAPRYGQIILESEAIARDLRAANWLSQPVDDISRWKAWKLTRAVEFATDVFEGDTTTLSVALRDEAETVLRAAGYEFADPATEIEYDPSEAAVDLAYGPRSTQQSVLRGVPTEVDYLNGEICPPGAVARPRRSGQRVRAARRARRRSAGAGMSLATQVEFISQIHLNPSTELAPVSTRGIDLEYLRRYVHALEDAGFDYTLIPYGSSGPDSFVLGSAVGQLSQTLRPIIALRPNTTFPLVAAQQLATLDQLTAGRAVVHLISGASNAEQARQGDYLPKDRRYARTEEFLRLLRRAWTEPQPFSHEGEFYKFDDFGPGLSTYSGKPIPISIGGQSDAAFRSAANWPTCSASGASPWTRSAPRSSACTASPTPPAGASARASGSRSARSSRPPRNSPGRRPGATSSRSAPHPATDRPRTSAPGARWTSPRVSGLRPRPVDPDRGGDRRPRRLHRARRHTRDRRRGDPRLHRPRRLARLDPRLRQPQRHDRLRPHRHPARPPRARPPRRHGPTRNAAGRAPREPWLHDHRALPEDP